MSDQPATVYFATHIIGLESSRTHTYTHPCLSLSRADVLQDVKKDVSCAVVDVFSPSLLK